MDLSGRTVDEYVFIFTEVVNYPTQLLKEMTQTAVNMKVLILCQEHGKVHEYLKSIDYMLNTVTYSYKNVILDIDVTVLYRNIVNEVDKIKFNNVPQVCHIALCDKSLTLKTRAAINEFSLAGFSSQLYPV